MHAEEPRGTQGPGEDAANAANAAGRRSKDKASPRASRRGWPGGHLRFGWGPQDLENTSRCCFRPHRGWRVVGAAWPLTR